jgi:hypothetical protein
MAALNLVNDAPILLKAFDDNDAVPVLQLFVVQHEYT